MMALGPAIEDDGTIRAWIEAYVAAWNSNQPEHIAALFSPDAVYRIEPHAEPWRGREAIVAGWLENRDEPGDTEFEWRAVGRDGDLWVVEGATRYHGLGRSYCNLWLVRLDGEGRCGEFKEWWMQRPAAEG